MRRLHAATIRWSALAAAALVCSVCMHWRLRELAFDDAWIHLRIARNLLDTGHAWFNVNERVMATSSPAWTLLLAALRVPRHLSTLPVLEALLWWCDVLLAVCLAWRTAALAGPCVRALLAALAGLLTGAVVVGSSIGQMETPLAMALLLGGWLLALNGSEWALAPLAFGALTRLELMPVWLLCAVGTVLLRRAWRGASASAAVVLSGLAWTYAQFHALLPNTIHAKQIGYNMSRAVVVRQFVAARRGSEVMAALVVLALLAAAVRRWRSQPRGVAVEWALLGSGVGLLIVAAYISQRTVLFSWYRPIFLLPLVLGMLLSARGGGGRGLAWVQVLHVVLAIYLGVPALQQLAEAVRAAARPGVAMKSRVEDGDYVRVQEYLQVGDVLQRTCPSQQLMSPEIGGLGWAYRGEIDDAFGLASPAALAFQPLRSGAPPGGMPVKYLLQVRPEIAVSYSITAVELLQDARVAAAYRSVALPTSPKSHRGGPVDQMWRASPHLMVWLRRDGGCDRDDVVEALHRQIG